MTSGRDAFWATSCIGAGFLFYQADQQGWPFCGFVRRVFHTDTRPGRLALGATLYGSTEILRRHLLNPRASLSAE